MSSKSGQSGKFHGAVEFVRFSRREGASEDQIRSSLRQIGVDEPTIHAAWVAASSYAAEAPFRVDWDLGRAEEDSSRADSPASPASEDELRSLAELTLTLASHGVVAAEGVPEPSEADAENTGAPELRSLAWLHSRTGWEPQLGRARFEAEERIGSGTWFEPESWPQAEGRPAPRLRPVPAPRHFAPSYRMSVGLLLILLVPALVAVGSFLWRGMRSPTTAPTRMAQSDPPPAGAQAPSSPVLPPTAQAEARHELRSRAPTSTVSRLRQPLPPARP